MKYILILILLLTGCFLQSPDKTPEYGHVLFDLDVSENSISLFKKGKSTSADTIFKLDSLVIQLSCPGESTIVNRYAISGRSDTGNIIISPKYFGPLAALKPRKALFYTFDTVNISSNNARNNGVLNQIKFPNSEPSIDQFYKGYYVYIISGPGAGESKHIISYTGSNRIATVESNWNTNPTSSSTYRIFLKDTVHKDSVNFYVKPSDTLIVNKTVNPRYSMLRCRVVSNNSLQIQNNVKEVRLTVNGVIQDFTTLNSKTFDVLLTYKYIKTNTSYNILLQAFDKNSDDRGYEKQFNLNVSSGVDTLMNISLTKCGYNGFPDCT